jgi:hypothetical protein
VSENITYEQVKEARRIVAELARKEYRDGGVGGEHFAGLVEAKRQLGIAISIHWPDRLDEVLEEQG